MSEKNTKSSNDNSTASIPCVIHGAIYIKDFPDGKYEGRLTFDQAERWGTGKQNFNDGSFYDGEWKHDFPHGPGVYTYANGDKYTGNSIKGKWNGKGELKKGDGTLYIGEFKDNKYHGR